MEETNVGQSKEGCRERESKPVRGAPRAPLASQRQPSFPAALLHCLLLALLGRLEGKIAGDAACLLLCLGLRTQKYPNRFLALLQAMCFWIYERTVHLPLGRGGLAVTNGKFCRWCQEVQFWWMWWGAGQGHGLGVGQSSWVDTGHREESRRLRLRAPGQQQPGQRLQRVQGAHREGRVSRDLWPSSPSCSLFRAPYGNRHTCLTPHPPCHCLLSSRTPREPCYGLWPGGLQFIGNKDLCCGLACCFP